jgi:hypothetical protein
MGRDGSLDKDVYACIYCGQTCSSKEILIAHERNCWRRAAKEAEWRNDRIRHGRRSAGSHRHKEGTDGD